MGDTPAALPQDDGGQDKPSRNHRLHRIAHYGEHVYLITVPGMILSAWIPDTWFGPLLGWAFIAVGFVALIMHFTRHHGKLCEECIATMPLDGDELATRHARWLRCNHWLTDNWRRTLLLLLGMYGVYFGLLWLGLSALGQTVQMGALGTFLYSTLRHKRLQPWCPQCRGRWRRDDDEEEPVAPPSPVMGAS